MFAERRQERTMTMAKRESSHPVRLETNARVNIRKMYCETIKMNFDNDIT